MHSFYLPPGNLEAVIVTGPEAAKLLQGQLTCDVEALPDNGITRGALCNNKGRVLAAFVLARQGADFYVVLNKGLASVFAQVLKKYQPFYKCALSYTPDTIIGVVGDAIAMSLVPEGLPPAGQCRSLGAGLVCTLDSAAQQYLVFGPGEIAVPPGAAVGSFDDWLVTGLRSGLFPFTAEDTEKYTPQELHLDRHGYVSFTKGCYTGQEIVARLHYRGKLKKLLFVLAAPATVEPAVAGENVEVVAGDSAVGTSVKTLFSDGMQYALAPLPAEFASEPPDTVKSGAGLEFSLRVF